MPADRSTLWEDFTIRRPLFRAGALCFGAGASGGIITDGTTQISVPLVLDLLNLLILAVVLVGVRWGRWSYTRGVATIIYAGALTFLTTISYDITTKSPPFDLTIYNNLFVLMMFMSPAVFLLGRSAALVFGGVIAAIMIGAVCTGTVPTLAVHLWYELPAMLGITYLLYRYRDSLNRVLDDLQRTARENKALRERERLAALGELSAGIAHEIKNPLNFVINFSESSTLLLDELETNLGLTHPSSEELQERDYLVGELRKNLEEVSRQGRRGGEIVQTMLSHARSGAATVRHIAVNELVEEAMQLAWMGWPAHKALVTPRFVPGPENVFIEGVRTDLSRALINLCSNAFWSVQERRRKNPHGYTPEVTVEVEVVPSKVSIQVKDNGVGLDPAHTEQLFVPFFTTKPPGEGTGLGLSLTREVVVDQHGGQVLVKGQPGQGACFTLVLPRGGMKP